MRHSFKVGLTFGLTSGVITTLGLIVGLQSSTNSKLAVLGGIIVIAIADALSDAMGIHISEEAQDEHSKKEIWEATIATFFSKFVFALTFVVPILVFELYTAVIVAVLWGLFLISISSFFIAKERGAKPHVIIIEHLLIATFVVVATHYVGKWVATFTP